MRWDDKIIRQRLFGVRNGACLRQMEYKIFEVIDNFRSIISTNKKGELIGSGLGERDGEDITSVRLVGGY